MLSASVLIFCIGNSPMAYRALSGALVLVCTWLSPALAEPAKDSETKAETVAVERPALPNEIPAPEAAPRAAQIEPVMVEPVKRVAPKTPDIKAPDIKSPEKKIKQIVTIEKDPTLDQKKSAATKASADKKSCGAGQKRNGNGCTKVAANKPSGKKRR